jgi:hypothetical protein
MASPVLLGLRLGTTARLRTAIQRSGSRKCCLPHYRARHWHAVSEIRFLARASLGLNDGRQMWNCWLSLIGEQFASCPRMSCQHRARTLLVAHSRGEPHTPIQPGTNPGLHIRRRARAIRRSRRRAARFARGQSDVRGRRRSPASQHVLAAAECCCRSSALLRVNTPASVSRFLDFTG